MRLQLTGKSVALIQLNPLFGRKRKKTTGQPRLTLNILSILMIIKPLVFALIIFTGSSEPLGEPSSAQKAAPDAGRGAEMQSLAKHPGQCLAVGFPKPTPARQRHARAFQTFLVTK